MSDTIRSMRPIEPSRTSALKENAAEGSEGLAEQLSRRYVCPADAGPAWRAAYEAGVDMALIEDALRMPPSERLREHQRALNQVLALVEARSTHDPRSRDAA